MVPILGIYAGRPSASRDAVLSHFPNAEYTEIPGTGHFLTGVYTSSWKRIATG